MDQNIKIDSVFEEKLCICGHYSVDKFTNITDTFIKYKNKLISFVEIIKETLGFEPDNCFMEICEQCKVKLQEFYNFKMRSIAARKNIIFENSDDTCKNEKLKELNDDKSTECTIIEVIKGYISKYSIKSIEIDENSKSLFIYPGKCEEEVKDSLNEKQDQTEESEEAPEYLEEFLDELNDSDSQQEFMDGEICHEEIIETEQIDDTVNDSSINSGTPGKRTRNQDDWACNKRKKLRNLGKSYLNSKGKIVGEKKMLESCAASMCRSNCQSRLSENDRLMNFNKFWQLGDVVEQRKFIYNHILTKEPTRRKSIQSNRSVTLQFYLDKFDTQDNSTCVQVCKKMFKNTLVISNQVIQGVISKYAKSGFIDVRGKHERKLTESQELARQHVQKFPFFYVEQNMTKIQLYNMYVDECKSKDIQPVKESNYREIFDKFNDSSFLKNGKYLCEKCNRFYTATEDEKKILQTEHNKHLEEDKKCRDRRLARIRYKRSMEKKKTDI